MSPPTGGLRHRWAAIVLAAGTDDQSRALLRRPLGESTVVGLALENVRSVVPAHRIVVVVSAADVEIRDLLGADLSYVEQATALGTGAATLLARTAIPEDTDHLLVTYGDTPLLRPDSILGLFNRHRLKGADLTILTAMLTDADPRYGRVLRHQGRISGIVEGTDRTPADAATAEHSAGEVNVGSYVAEPQRMFQELERMAAFGEHRLTLMADRVIHDGGRVECHQIHDRDEVQGINSPEELEVAADIVLKRLFVPRKNTDTRIHFGTGGWRAVIGEGYTLANVRRLCQAIANEIIREGREEAGVVIGCDRRFLARDSAVAAAEVFAGDNIRVILLPDDVPTPLVTFAVPHVGAAYGLVVTASHNPPEWNGIKVFRADGSLPMDDETRRFQNEANLLTVDDVITLDLPTAMASGMVEERTLTNPYVDAIERVIDIEVARDKDLHVIVDPMYGTSQLTLGLVLGDMRVRTEFIHSAHNPLFGGVAPAPDLERLSALISMIKAGRGRYDLGLATDGDSDRIGIVDENGEYVTTNDLLLVLYWYLHEIRGEKGGIVRNISTTHMLDRLARHLGEESLECKVGFRYVTAGMEQIGAVLGGESSGGLTIRGWIQGKDGIFACALVVEMLARTGRRISELRDMIHAITGRLHQLEESVAATPEMRVAVPRRLEAQPLTQVGPYRVERVSYLDGTKIHLSGDNWLLLRFSGTEPALRLVVEAETPERAAELMDWLRGFVTA